MKRTIRTLLLAGLVVAAALGAIAHFEHRPTPATTASHSTTATSTVTLSVDHVFTKTIVPINANETVLQLLQAENAIHPSIALQTKTYKGLGTMVTAMGGIMNGTQNEYWQYQVDGTLPQVGADALLLHPGDSVTWFFATSSE